MKYVNFAFDITNDMKLWLLNIDVQFIIEGEGILSFSSWQPS